MTPRHLRSNAGFTLVEMLVAVAIAGVVGMAAMTVFTTSSKTTTAQTDLSDAQQNVRASMDRISQHVRAAGFGLPERQSFSLTFNGVNYNRPVDIINSATGPDSLTLVGIGYNAGELAPMGSDGCNAANTNCLLLQNPDTLLANAKYISIGGASFQEVSSVSGNNKLTLTSQIELPNEFFSITPPPSIYILQVLRYTIATDLNNCSTLQPCLVVQDLSGVTGAGNRQVLAQGIEDLQIGIFQSPAAGGAATFSPGASTASANISALRINLIGKSRNADRQSIFIRPTLEDRTPASDPDSFLPDSFRRRVLTTVVKVRNPRPSS